MNLTVYENKNNKKMQCNVDIKIRTIKCMIQVIFHNA